MPLEFPIGYQLTEEDDQICNAADITEEIKEAECHDGEVYESFHTITQKSNT